MLCACHCPVRVRRWSRIRAVGGTSPPASQRAYASADARPWAGTCAHTGAVSRPRPVADASAGRRTAVRDPHHPGRAVTRSLCAGPASVY